MSAKQFNPSNPEQLIYQNDLLKLTVLGGIKLEGLDRMRAITTSAHLQPSLKPSECVLESANHV